MGAQLIDGKAVAAKVRGEVKDEVARMKAARGLVPGLAVVRVNYESVGVDTPEDLARVEALINVNKTV